MTRVVAKWGLLRGVDRAIETVGRSGEAVFARDDTPEQAGYDVARAIDQHRDALKWNIRPYAYDSRTVFENFGVPLHPGAARYYREVGYLTGRETVACSTRADAGASDAGDAGHVRAAHTAPARSGSGGCGAARGVVDAPSGWALLAAFRHGWPRAAVRTRAEGRPASADLLAGVGWGPTMAYVTRRRSVCLQP